MTTRGAFLVVISKGSFKGLVKYPVTSELLINKMLNAQNPNSKSSDFASKMDQRGVEPLSENPFPVLLLS